MKIINIIFCIALFLLGMRLGELKEPGTIVVTETKQEAYLDFTAPDLRHRLEVCANTLNLTLKDKAAVDALHSRWLLGYKDGYRDGKR